MPIKIDPNQTFEATAEINLKAFKASFGVICKLLDTDEIKRLQKEWTGTPPVYADPVNDPFNGIAPTTPRVEPTLNDREFIDHWLVGFAADVQDAAGQPLPFTPENVSLLLKQPGANMAVINGFIGGYSEAETKNSNAPLAG